MIGRKSLLTIGAIVAGIGISDFLGNFYTLSTGPPVARQGQRRPIFLVSVLDVLPNRDLAITVLKLTHSALTHSL
jgi:hypothetical protein